MTDPATIREICSRLDPENDAHWTSQGVPRMDVLAGMGLSVERRELNEALPGFNRERLRADRAEALAAAQADAETPAQEQAPAGEQPDFFRHAKARAARRSAALEHLAKGGFSLKDLEPVRSRADRAIGARNRQARRELS